MTNLCTFYCTFPPKILNFYDADIKTISEFKDSFGKYYPVFPKNPKNWGVKSAGFWLKL